MLNDAHVFACVLKYDFAMYPILMDVHVTGTPLVVWGFYLSLNCAACNSCWQWKPDRRRHVGMKLELFSTLDTDSNYCWFKMHVSVCVEDVGRVQGWSDRADFWMPYPTPVHREVLKLCACPFVQADSSFCVWKAIREIGQIFFNISESSSKLWTKPTGMIMVGFG